MRRICKSLLLILLIVAFTTALRTSSDVLGSINNDPLDGFYGWESTLTAEITPYNSFLILEISYRLKSYVTQTYDSVIMPPFDFYIFDSSEKEIWGYNPPQHIVMNYAVDYGHTVGRTEFSLLFGPSSEPVPENHAGSLCTLLISNSDTYEFQAISHLSDIVH
ncbi:MAG: hypothetical protein ACFFCQ_16095, partial [Promethearchaeota archaeon]